MNEQPIRILAIEDDQDYVEILRLCLAEPDAMELKFEVDSAERLAAGLTKLTAGRYDAVLVDLGLPDASGLEAARAVLAAAPDIPVLVSTNYGDEKTALEAMRLGAQDFMIKASSDSRMLKRSIRYSIERKSAHGQRDQIIRASADGMAVVDAVGRIQFVNAAAEKILNAPAARLIGQPFPYPAHIGETKVLEIPKPSGGQAAVEMRVTQVSWDSGPAMLANLRDITELRRVEQLKSEIAERRRVDKLKDEWIETISHDLRTRLTIIKGAVVELHEGRAEPLQPQQSMLIGLARRQVERVERMVVNLLDLSRMESGRAKVEKKSLDACALIRRVAGDFSRSAAERAITIETDCEPGTPEAVADPDLFEQLVVNLVENALRFARSRISVRIRAAASGDFELSVQDDGVGIPPEKKSLLFTRFNQLERQRGPDGYKGTGLGLAICKEIVALHRGRIDVVSEPGQGALFLITLPAAGAAAAPPAEARGVSDPKTS
ncbi:MAG TPA: ATP-binding protein [Elusimicrobiota bacterium]|nr:ATP-binding protein [Elusimicrobiota bacterium]